MQIYVAFYLTESEQSLLRAALLPTEQVTFRQNLPEDQRFDVFSQAEVAFGNVPIDWVEKNHGLHWLQLYSAGIDPYQKLNLSGRPQPLTLTHLRDFFGKPVAETAVAGILALYRKIDELSRLQSQQHWVGGVLRPRMQLLHEKKVVVLGAGAIGSTIRKILEGFSCEVQMVRRSTYPTLAYLDQLLPEADILISSLPETTETRGILDARRLGLMKKSALFVNVGRGSLVDELALIEALKQSRLGGAVLDVSHTEPLPKEHPLWLCPNVVLTQHTGGGYDEENADKVRVFTENLRRYRAGKPLLHVVDLQRGY
jgi:glyoxylate/hydroxypyruvate reductase